MENRKIATSVSRKTGAKHPGITGPSRSWSCRCPSWTHASAQPISSATSRPERWSRTVWRACTAPGGRAASLYPRPANWPQDGPRRGLDGVPLPGMLDKSAGACRFGAEKGRDSHTGRPALPWVLTVTVSAPQGALPHPAAQPG